MTEPMDIAQWARQWEAMSRQAWAGMPGATAQPGLDPSAFFARAFPGMTSGLPGAGNAQSELIERLMAGAQGYLGMLQSLAGGAGGSATMPGSNWMDALSSGFAAPTSVPMFSNPFASAMRSIGGNGAAGFEHMMERFNSAAAPLLGQAKDAMSQPAFGFLRQHQENAQRAGLAQINYQEQIARYNRLLLKVSEQAFARFQGKLAEREEPGRQIDSIRALYDLWIDAAEEAYAEIALSEEFREVYGAVVNAQMRVREHVQREIERLSNDLGVPTRSEIDSIGQRLQELRREFRNEREDEAGVAALREEVQALRTEIDALKSARRAPAAPSNVVEFPRASQRPAAESKVAPKAAKARRAAKASKKAAAERPRKPVAKKRKAARQIVQTASTTAALPAKPQVSPRKAERPPETGEDASAKQSFAARIARFARKAKTGSARPPGKSAAAHSRRNKR